MKKKVAERVEKKENLLSGNALELNEADLEGVAGGISIEDVIQRSQEHIGLGTVPETKPADPEVLERMMESEAYKEAMRIAESQRISVIPK